MTDIIIIGAGIVGLASAMKLLEQQPALNILVLEKEKDIARHQTGNNSGVIHSGIYYKPGSLKAKNCLDGYRMLLEFCRGENIPFEICGKIIVATDEYELNQLQNIFERGIKNGLAGVKLIDSNEIRFIEPHCIGIKGIYVPQTGIINYVEVSQKYAGKIKSGKGEIRLAEKIVNIQHRKNLVKVITQKNEFEAKILINCAGLYSDKIARMTGNQQQVRIIPFRGEYYFVKKNKEFLVRNLIYPVPDPAFPFLGVHFTRFISGGVEAGPNAVLAYAREGYRKRDVNLPEFLATITSPNFLNLAAKYWRTGVEEFYRSYSKSAFTKALKRLIPEIEDDDLLSADAGVRATAVDRNGNVTDDFIIEKQDGIIHVLNSPSPAATASLAIGKYIADMALEMI